MAPITSIDNAGLRPPFLVGEGVTLPFACIALFVSTAVFLYLRRLSRTTGCASQLGPTRATPLTNAHDTAGDAQDPKMTSVRVAAPLNSETEPSPVAKAAQTNFLRVVSLCYLADWMKGAYTIALFNAYGLTVSEIATLFIVGYIASLFFGTIAGAVADVMGRAHMCRWFCVLLAFSMLTKLSPNFWILALGRAVGGVADSLLATVFEAWFVSQFQSQGPLFVRETFTTLASYRSLSAVIAGAAAQVLATLFGNVAPFVASVPIVCVAFVWMRNWEENYGGTVDRNPLGVLVSCAKHIARDRRLQLLCGCESLFEACMYIWVFNWSSALDRSNRQTPFGLVFAVFMISMMCGGVLARRWTVGYWLATLHVCATGAAVLAVLAFSFKNELLIAFAFTEVTVGLYYATHPTLRAELVNNSTRSAIMGLFRVPMNVVVFVVLQLHLSPRQNLCVLVVLQLASGLCLYALRRTGATPP